MVLHGRRAVGVHDLNVDAIRRAFGALGGRNGEHKGREDDGERRSELHCVAVMKMRIPGIGCFNPSSSWPAFKPRLKNPMLSGDRPL